MIDILPSAKKRCNHPCIPSGSCSIQRRAFSRFQLHVSTIAYEQLDEIEMLIRHRCNGGSIVKSTLRIYVSPSIQKSLHYCKVSSYTCCLEDVAVLRATGEIGIRPA